MRRTIVVLLSSVVLLAVLVGPASARTLTVRSDPNDTPDHPDIRKVSTDVSRRSVFVSIRSWERFRAVDAFLVVLDTRGDIGPDRVIEMLPGQCVAEKTEPDITFIGDRDSRRLGPRELACRLPVGWFGIRKPVRFAVNNSHLGDRHNDRAPNRDRYVGL